MEDSWSWKSDPPFRPGPTKCYISGTVPAEVCLRTISNHFLLRPTNQTRTFERTSSLKPGETYLHSLSLAAIAVPSRATAHVASLAKARVPLTPLTWKPRQVLLFVPRLWKASAVPMHRAQWQKGTSPAPGSCLVAEAR